MHNARSKVDRRTLLVAVSRCSNEGLRLAKHGCCGFWKSRAGWSRLNSWTTPLRESRASLCSRAQTKYKLAPTKVIVGVKNLHLLPMARKELLLAYNLPHKASIHTDCVTNRAGACGGIVLKTLQNVFIKLRRANWSSSPCARPVHCKCTSFP